MRLISVDSEKAGKKIRCAGCQTVLTIPQTATGAGEKPNHAHESADPQQPNAAIASSNQLPSSEASRQRRRPQRRKRSDASNPDDVWAQPLSSYSSPALEDHEYEELGIRRQQPKERNADGDSTEVSLKGPIVICAAGLVIGLIAIGLAFAVPKIGLFMSYAVIGVGALLSLWGHWQIRALAFRESSLTGFLYLWFFPYSMYFIFTRFSATKTAFFAQLLGNVVTIAGIIGMVLSNIQIENATGTAYLEQYEKDSAAITSIAMSEDFGDCTAGSRT